MISSRLLALISISPIFILGLISPVQANDIPESKPPKRSPSRATRGDCLVVPLLPSGSNASETRSENPIIWLYVRPSTKASTNQLTVHSIREPLDQAKIISLDDKGNPRMNPMFISISLPVGQQKLIENQNYTFTLKCNGDGNAIAVNIKLVSRNNLRMADLDLGKQVSNLTKSGLWSEATNLFMATPSKLVCGKIDSSNRLFEENMTNLFNKVMRPQNPKTFEPLELDIQRNIFLTYRNRIKQTCK
ncbi:DUF928 domain-containing protein [Pseudanabaena sp. BC1403]|uniref:DUF928 domain-containing protein n=1 Tax=Pseudanabaena sp. BC1403 TaxID=2043171 RepID=UPI000CD90C5E|nr:DUF928 domain-containing protein [Pseudanabaena sp. BC1403]